MDRVLVPVDFSEHAHRAIEAGAAFARAHGAELDLLHVLTLHGHDAAADEARRRLAALRPADLPGEDRVVRGIEAAPAILEAAAHAGLVAMATHGGGLARALLGSVTDRVLRHAPCPVLVVREPLPVASGELAVRRLLVATDLAERHDAALARLAGLLAGRAPDLVVAVHALEAELPVLYTMAGVQGLLELHPELAERVEAELRARVERWFPEPPPTVRLVVREGRAPRVVADLAREEGADLVAISGETRIDLEERLIGGTAERIARRSPCSVLVL